MRTCHRNAMARFSLCFPRECGYMAFRLTNCHSMTVPACWRVFQFMKGLTSIQSLWAVAIFAMPAGSLVHVTCTGSSRRICFVICALNASYYKKQRLPQKWSIFPLFCVRHPVEGCWLFPVVSLVLTLCQSPCGPAAGTDSADIPFLWHRKSRDKCRECPRFPRLQPKRYSST